MLDARDWISHVLVGWAALSVGLSRVVGATVLGFIVFAGLFRVSSTKEIHLGGFGIFFERVVCLMLLLLLLRRERFWMKEPQHRYRPTRPSLAARTTRLAYRTTLLNLNKLDDNHGFDQIISRLFLTTKKNRYNGSAHVPQNLHVPRWHPRHHCRIAVHHHR